MNYRILFFILLFLFITTSIFILTTNEARNALKGISVHPSNFDFTYNGKPLREDITVDNSTNQDIQIAVQLKNFTAEGEEGGVALTTENTGFSLASWITVTPMTALIKKNSSQQFSFTISPPYNAEPGGRFGSIVFATVPNTKIAGTGASLSEQVASLILLKVPGNAEEKALVESLITDKNFYEFGPVTFSLRIHNMGEVHIQPYGAIVVSGILGQRFSLPIDPRTVLPNSIRKIPIVLSNKLLLGMYTAHLVASYGTKGIPLYGEATFYAFPIRYGIVLFILLLFLFLARRRIRTALHVLITGSAGLKTPHHFSLPLQKREEIKGKSDSL